MDQGDSRHTLQQWRNGLRLCHAGHARAASGAVRAKRAIGVPAVVLATIAGGSGLSTISGGPTDVLAVISGAAGVAAGVLAGLQTFLDLDKTAAAHERAAAEFGDLRRQVEQLLLGDDAPALASQMTSVRKRWRELELDTPAIPRRIHDEIREGIPRAERPATAAP